MFVIVIATVERGSVLVFIIATFCGHSDYLSFAAFFVSVLGVVGGGAPPACHCDMSQWQAWIGNIPPGMEVDAVAECLRSLDIDPEYIMYRPRESKQERFAQLSMHLLSFRLRCCCMFGCDCDDHMLFIIGHACSEFLERLAQHCMVGFACLKHRGIFGVSFGIRAFICMCGATRGRLGHPPVRVAADAAARAVDELPGPVAHDRQADVPQALLGREGGHVSGSVSCRCDHFVSFLLYAKAHSSCCAAGRGVIYIVPSPVY